MNGSAENTTPDYQSRRATLEDLPELRSLWHAARLPLDDLEKRFTEFQIVTNAEGNLVGAVGLQTHKQHGLIHSETYTAPELATEVRPLLWQRILTVAKNNGLVRLWALPVASFYREQGFVDVDEPLRAKLPELFGNPKVDWVSLKLKDENQNAATVEREFEVFAMAQKQESERLMSQARSFKVIAYGLLFVVLAAIAALAFVFSRLRNRRGR
jgi:N-acetylglutamate synthase-like GNAT family acetyltransferase